MTDIENNNIKNLYSFFNNTNVKCFIQLLLVVYIVFYLPNTKKKDIESFSNPLIRLIIVLMILLFLLIEHFSIAILLTLSFILSIQQLNYLTIKNY